ncbi:MAG: response regulator transcription factor [Tenericutes bacterium]|nr:response regulator transcription factor [Mycoplasmatota bacterium]MDY3801295.1 response regulator transcription factor [Bacilli bacterium]
MSRILIIDDEVDIAELESDALTDEGFDVDIAHLASEANILLEKNNYNYDLILLDIMMPGKSGTEYLNEIRNKITCPIIFVSAKSGTVDKLLGLEIGADDYITKPFDIYELVARVKAHIRRESRSKEIENKSKIIIGEIEINKNSYDVYKNKVKCNVSTREFEVLWYLMSNAGIVLTKEQIFSSVWGSDYGEIGTVAVHIKSLRSKIDPEEKYIVTIWGVGYKFVKELENE